MSYKKIIIGLVALTAFTSTVFRAVVGSSEAKQQNTLSEPSRLDAFFSASTGEPGNGTSVLLITIDTLRPDHMGMYGYQRNTSPKMDAFASESAVFTRAYATAPLTTPSIVSMLTGERPNVHGVRVLWQPIDSSTITVVDHLHRAGYQTAAVVSNIVLGNDASRLGERFSYYDETVDEPEAHRPHMLERRASRTTDAAIAWIQKHRDPKRPFFLWVHYIDPHGPYDAPKDAPIDFTHDQPTPVSEERIADYVREPHLVDGAEYVDRYDEEIAYTDREVGRLLYAFDAIELEKPPLTILTSDHGENMMEGAAYFSHGYDVNNAVIHIPLIARHPSLEFGRRDQITSITDITPTILDVVGLKNPKQTDGVSLLQTSTHRRVYAEGLDSGGSGGLHRTLITDTVKAVVRHGRSNEPRESWRFDLEVDPTQRNRLAVDQTDPLMSELVRLIRSDPDPGGRPTHKGGHAHSHGLVSGDVDPKALNALRKLGYVE